MRSILTQLLVTLWVVAALAAGTYAQPTLERAPDRPVGVTKPAPTPKAGPEGPPATVPKAAPEGPPATVPKAGKTRRDLKVQDPRARLRKAGERTKGMSFKPAPEQVEVSCPKKVVHIARLDESDPELRAWKASPTQPSVVRVELRFSSFGPESWGSTWQRSSTVECRYNTVGEGQNYRQILTRRIHASGTPYHCKVTPRGSRTAECRLEQP